jgi:hypothetical protein
MFMRVCGVAALIFASSAVPFAGQNPARPSKAAKPYTTPRTPWGDPDLQGVWPGTDMVGTPLERPLNFGERNALTEDEYRQRQARAKNQEVIDSQETVNDITRCDPNRGGLGNTPTTCSNGVSIGPPLYWDDRGKPTYQASLVVEPKNGRIPPLTAAAQKMQAERAAARQARPCATVAGGCHDSWEDDSLWDRCITRGTVGSIIPNTYNQGNQIVQAPGVVIFRNEMIHESRVIPVDGRPHLPQAIRTWMGDSRGHWEGSTLVVETTNFTDKTRFRGSTANLKVTEQFTRVDANTLRYRFTVEDTDTWERPWTGEYTWPITTDHVYEYACHEGNYALGDILRGARLREAEDGRKTKQQ